jgi:excisionase family DNA binding protein
MKTSDHPIAMSVAEAAAAAGVSRTTIYLCIKAGELPVVKLGTRTLVMHNDLVQFLSAKRVA